MTLLGDLADGARRLKDLGEAVATVEQKEQLLELRKAVLAAEAALIEAEEEIKRLNAALEAAHAVEELKSTLVEVDGFMYGTDESGNPSGLPYCPVCLNDGDPIRIIRYGPTVNERRCPKCKAEYGRSARKLTGTA